MNKKDASLLLPAITLIVAIAGFLYSYNVLMPSVAENMTKIEAYDADIAKAQSKLDSIASANKSMAKLSDLVNSLLVAVPDSVDSPNLITEIESIAAQNQVALPSLAPPTEISTSTDTGEGLIVNLSISGSYANILNFVNALENSIRFSKITSLTFSASEDGSLSSSITYEVYRRPAAPVAITEQPIVPSTTESAPVAPENDIITDTTQGGL